MGGVSSGRPCTICTHAKRADIDKALLNGWALRKISQNYGVTVQSIIRHRDRHLQKLLQAAAAEEQRQEAALGSDLLDQAKHLQKAALGFMTQAYRAGDLRTALAGVREATRLLELQGKLMGEIAPTTVNVLVTQEFRVVQVAMLEALEQHPEAKAAVLAALQRLGGGPAALQAA